MGHAMAYDAQIKIVFDKNLPEKVERRIKIFLLRIAGGAQKIAKLNAPVDVGQLRDSIVLKITAKPPIFEASIVTNNDHAVVQEEGRRPGGKFPPPMPIRRWIQRHRGSFGLKGGKAGERQLQSLTFLVSRKIAKLGFKGHKFFAKAFRITERRVPEFLRLAGLDIQSLWKKGG